MPRIPFSSVFRVNPTDGSIEPTQRIRIGGVELAPGTILRRGQVIAGIDFTQYTDRDFEITVDDQILVIRGIYAPRR